MAKTLFIDGQVFQSVAWDRGMGKYSLALLRAMTGNKQYDYDKTYIVFTKNFPLKSDAKQAISQAAPAAEHIFADLKVPADPSSANVPELQKQNRVVLDELVGELVAGEDFTYLILALFIDQVCSVFPAQGHRSLLFYDLIPLQYSERYSLLASYKNYLARYKTVFEADVILTISQTVADDVALNLGIAPTKIFNINGAPIKHSSTKPKKPDIALPKDFVLMPSGDEIRKNNVRAVQGFETYRRESQANGAVLVVTSHFTKAARDTLRAYSKHVVFTGNVPEEELQWLYENAQALLFVPEYEGLGLPILEAAGAGLPIVCSNLTVFNEISPTAFYYADPEDPVRIANSLKQAIARTDFTQKTKEYPAILARYTWDNTAELALKALGLRLDAAQTEKIKLAVLTPSPGGYSAIGKLVMQLHPAMLAYFDIDYYVEEARTHQDFTRPDYLPYISRVRPASDFDRKAYRQYDAVLYHIGNSEFHMDTIKSALCLPGYGIFHDTHLAEVFEGALPTYHYLNEDRIEAERLLDKKIANPKASYISSIVNNQRALIAHSNYTREALDNTKLEKSMQIGRLNLPTATPQQSMPRRTAALTIGLAGIIHPAKGLDIIERLAQTDDFYTCKIHIFGLSLVSDEVIDRLRAYPNVTVDTDVTDFQFQTMLSQVDVLVNFRTEYRGETSLATVEAMRFGVVPIVKKIGWYDELPDDAVIKVRNVEQVIDKLRTFAADPSKLTAMQQAARQYIADNHTYAAYARELYEFLAAQSAAANQADKVAAAIKGGASLGKVKQLLHG